jgi:hypothetical protein
MAMQLHGLPGLRFRKRRSFTRITIFRIEYYSRVTLLGINMNKALALFFGVLAFSVGGQAWADTTWILGGSGATSGVTVSGYSNTGGSNSSVPADSQTIQLQPLGTNTIWYSGGWGINNLDGCSAPCFGGGDLGDLANTAPEHAIDNNERYDMALLKFTASPVKLTGVSLGYAFNDSDITVMAYTGSGNPETNGKLAGLTYDKLTLNGWQTIGNYSDVGTSSPKPVNATSVFSSYWLIGAYNALAAPTGGSVTGGATSYDYVKLFSVTGTLPTTTQSVSEPGSTALLGVALLAMVTLRKTRAAVRRTAARRA